MDRYRELAEKAFDYAIANHTFTKVDIINKSENVVVYGLGKYFEDAYIKQNVAERFHVKYLCDGNSEKLKAVADSKKYSEKCISIDLLANLDNPVVILMLGDPRSALERLAIIVGKINCITYNDLVLDSLMTVNHQEDYFEKQKQDMLMIFDSLADEKSKKVYANVLANRIAPQYADATYEQMCTLPQYFPGDIMKLSDDECVVDAGAYIGDTLQEFNSIVDGKFEKYYAFELDKENYELLSDNAKSISKDRIECIPYGIWSEDRDIAYGKMSSADSYSVFNEKEVEPAKVVSIDNYLNGKK